MQNSGNAGIGIFATNPGANADFVLKDAANTGYWDFAVINGAGAAAPTAGSFIMYDALNSKYTLVIEPNTPNDTLYLKNNGNVGIATTAPKSPLDVNGGITGGGGGTSASEVERGGGEGGVGSYAGATAAPATASSSPAPWLLEPLLKPPALRSILERTLIRCCCP